LKQAASRLHAKNNSAFDLKISPRSMHLAGVFRVLG